MNDKTSTSRGSPEMSSVTVKPDPFCRTKDFKSKFEAVYCNVIHNSCLRHFSVFKMCCMNIHRVATSFTFELEIKAFVCGKVLKCDSSCNSGWMTGNRSLRRSFSAQLFFLRASKANGLSAPKARLRLRKKRRIVSKTLSCEKINKRA